MEWRVTNAPGTLTALSFNCGTDNTIQNKHMQSHCIMHCEEIHQNLLGIAISYSYTGCASMNNVLCSYITRYLS